MKTISNLSAEFLLHKSLNYTCYCSTVWHFSLKGGESGKKPAQYRKCIRRGVHKHNLPFYVYSSYSRVIILCVALSVSGAACTKGLFKDWHSCTLKDVLSSLVVVTACRACCYRIRILNCVVRQCKIFKNNNSATSCPKISARLAGQSNLSKGLL